MLPQIAWGVVILALKMLPKAACLMEVKNETGLRLTLAVVLRPGLDRRGDTETRNVDHTGRASIEAILSWLNKEFESESHSS